MELIPVKVECHSGFKADEYPRKFTWDQVEFEITDIIDRWYEGYNSPASPASHASPAVNYYKVKTDLKGSFLLKHELGDDKWYLVV